MPLRTVILMDRSEEHQPIYLFSFRVKKYYFILIFFFFKYNAIVSPECLKFLSFLFSPILCEGFFFFLYIIVKSVFFNHFSKNVSGIFWV